MNREKTPASKEAGYSGFITKACERMFAPWGGQGFTETS
jgi:hypothetical protein